VVLEITPPRHLRGIHHAVLNFAMPAVGGLLGGNPDAFGALAQSVGNMPPPVEVAAMLSRCGIADIRWREFAAGMATLHYGRVATA
jgi:ubiquinone/menaquinone biosynthesis C-methylase UbiE